MKRKVELTHQFLQFSPFDLDCHYKESIVAVREWTIGLKK